MNPALPGMPEMRAAFEAHWSKKYGRAPITWKEAAAQYELDNADWDRYLSSAAEEAWDAWQAGFAAGRAEASKDAGWLPIDTAPHGRKLIVGYPNKLGNWRTVMACYYGDGELPQPDDYDDEFAPAGWYEESESHEFILATDEAPTHWQPLPIPPAATPTKEQP